MLPASFNYFDNTRKISTGTPFREIQNQLAFNQPSQKAGINSAVKTQTLNIHHTLNSVNRDYVGTPPIYSKNQKAKLGSGKGKTVSIMTALQKTISKKNKTGWKDIALSTPITVNKAGQEAEALVLKKLSEDPNSKNFTPKTYYAGIIDGKLITAQKLISGGEARHCLPFMSIKDRLNALVGYAGGLDFLHSKNIIHNDTALRNMLIDLMSKNKNLNESLGQRLAKPIFDEQGNTLIDAKELINGEVQLQLEALNISQVKVYVNEPSKGVIIDFDRCTFSDNMHARVLLGTSIDYSAPERQLAVDRYKMIKDNPNSTKEELEKARNCVLSNSNKKTDAFSLGQLICDALLRPSLDTSLTESNYQYLILCHQRKEKRIAQYKELSSRIPFTSTTSAIEPDDFQALHKISPELAQFVSKLMSYNPLFRPSINQSIQILERESSKCQDATSQEDFDRLFNAFDDKKPAVLLQKPQPAFNMFQQFSDISKVEKIEGYNET